MNREPVRILDNRAVTPLFRALGGRRVEPEGDAVRLADAPAMHRLEWRVLAALVPGMLAVAIFDALWRLGGPWLAWPVTAPALFLGLHVVAIAVGRRQPAGAFWGWALLIAGWAVFAAGQPPGVASFAARGWLGFLALQAACLPVSWWRRLMSVGGRRGLVVRSLLALGLHLGMAAVWWRFGWPWGVACGALICGLWCWGTFLPGSGIYGPVVTRVHGTGVLLTIDDGPDPDDTPAILDLLDRHGVKAVFFVIGERVRRFPDLAREIVARGHELGNHTMTHPQASMWCAGPGRTRREIVECQQAIEEVTGRSPRWFRAPVGHRNYFTHPVAAELGLEVVGWSRRGFDTLDRDVDRIVADLCDGATDGDILLLHEGTSQAPEVVRRVLERLASPGS